VAAIEPAQVPGVLMAISERLLRETSTDQAATLWTATEVLMGLRYSKKQVEEFIRGVSAMILGIRGIEESSVYQDIFAKGEAKGRVDERIEGRIEGRIEEARLAIMRVGRKRFGKPDEGVQMMIDAINDIDRLNSVLDRILDVLTTEQQAAVDARRADRRTPDYQEELARDVDAFRHEYSARGRSGAGRSGGQAPGQR
jgi:hypothetical protein